MECKKCGQEIKEDSRFCGNCGAKAEKSELSRTIDESMEICKKCWFILGFHRGICKAQKDKKALKEFEDLIKTKSKEIFQDYLKVTEYWKEKINEK